MTKIRIQLGSDPQTSVLAAIAEAASGSVSGGALMAWASRRGLESLFGNTSFSEFVSAHPFRLVIGVDAVTDTAALNTLAELRAAHPGLSASVFVHDKSWLFHPKLVWFIRADGSVAIVAGSGNLTSWGLRSSWEATVLTTLVDEEAASTISTLARFIGDHQEYLLDPDDQRVRDRAARNSGTENSIRHARSLVPSPAPEVGEQTQETLWLVTELRKSRKNARGESMFSQASFSRQEFDDFFGYVEGGMDIQLFEVEADGGVGALESRRGRYKPASVNYYFELGAARGLPYPSTGSPVAVFCRLESGEFLYTLVLPGAPGTGELDALLSSEAQGGGKRHAIVTRAQIEAAWPGCPIFVAVEPVG